jgi:hypothetical protein
MRVAERFSVAQAFTPGMRTAETNLFSAPFKGLTGGETGLG